MRCNQFLEGYSDYTDGRLESAARERFDAHLKSCDCCKRYHRVLRRGLAEYKSLPDVESSPDFGPRLQHRLFHVDDAGRLSARRHLGSAALVAVASVGFLALVWLPFATRLSVEIELPPVAVDLPPLEAVDAGPDLFREGPYFTPVSQYWIPLQPTLDESSDLFDPNSLTVPMELVVPPPTDGSLDSALDGSR